MTPRFRSQMAWGMMCPLINTKGRHVDTYKKSWLIKWKSMMHCLGHAEFEVWPRHSGRTAGLRFRKRSEIQIWGSSA